MPEVAKLIRRTGVTPCSDLRRGVASLRTGAVSALLSVVLSPQVLADRVPLSAVSVGVDFGAALTEGRIDTAAGIDLKYHASKAVAAGLRIEGTGLAKRYIDAAGVERSSDTRISAGYILSLNHVFDPVGGVHPFVELGAGRYRLPDVASDSLSALVSQGRDTGYMAKAGFEFDRIRVAFALHAVPTKSVVVDGVHQSIDNNYAMLSVGYFVGGFGR